jgi:Holliday junction resolvase-like predicted endonuclease
MVSLEKIVNSGKSIEEILEKLDWKDFEKAVAEIFERNDFKIKHNFWFKTKNRYQIDVIAIRQGKIFCVDCKQWGKGRYKKTGLKQAVKEQEKRVKELRKFLKKNFIAQSMLKIDLSFKFYPLIVTLLQEDVVKENETFVVPVWKLNNFLMESDIYL